MDNASQTIDQKLDKISKELYNQRSLTKDDVMNWWTTPPTSFPWCWISAFAVMRQGNHGVVQEKTEYFKSEIDAFFIQRQQDLARENAAAWC